MQPWFEFWGLFLQVWIVVAAMALATLVVLGAIAYAMARSEDK